MIETAARAPCEARALLVCDRTLPLTGRHLAYLVWHRERQFISAQGGAAVSTGVL